VVTGNIFLKSAKSRADSAGNDPRGVRMLVAPQTTNEDSRLAELQDLEILDTLPEQAYDDITYLASAICKAPIALVSLVDRDRQWFKSRVGLTITETPRSVAFCAHAILEPTNILVVNDARNDDRFSGNPLVTKDPAIRFYAGTPLVTSQGNALGTLCVIDTEPRELTDEQAHSLHALARQVVAQLELRRTVGRLRKKDSEHLVYEKQLEVYQHRLEENLATIRHLSLTDPLTGLFNRRALMDKLNEECALLARYNTEVSFALIDIDRFKQYNDTYGHLAGDELLEAVAKLVESNSRSTDVVARYGGDEFAVIFRNTGIEGAHRLAERIRTAIEEAPWPRGDITASIGIAAGIPSAATPSRLIDAADRALYRSKEAGRNRVGLTVSV
jgi:diguanylate cyclase (GGDEF)-like protein